jgi:hypothetical protein
LPCAREAVAKLASLAPDQHGTDRARSTAGARLAGFIYGTIVALAVVVAGARAYPHEAGHIAALVAVTAVALWVAHVYAHGLGHAVAQDEHLTFAELQHIARREGSIVEAALPPVVALLLGAIGLLSTQTAVWIAFGLGLAVLAAQGIRFARIEHLGPLGTLLVVAANISLGALLIALKLALTH